MTMLTTKSFTVFPLLLLVLSLLLLTPPPALSFLILKESIVVAHQDSSSSATAATTTTVRESASVVVNCGQYEENGVLNVVCEGKKDGVFVGYVPFVSDYHSPKRHPPKNN